MLAHRKAASAAYTGGLQQRVITGSRTASRVRCQAQRSLVLAVDQNMHAHRAVKWTLEHLYKEGDVLHLLHVIPKDQVHMPTPAAFLCAPAALESTESLDYEEMVEQSANKFIQETLVRVAQAFSVPVAVDILHAGSGDSVGRAICKKSEELQAAMVVVIAQERSFWEDLFSNSSYSKFVVDNCKQPTLVFHPKGETVEVQRQQTVLQ